MVFGFYVYSADRLSAKPYEDLVPDQLQGDEIDIELLGKPLHREKGRLRSVGPPKGLWLNTFNNKDGRVYPLQDYDYPGTPVVFPNNISNFPSGVLSHSYKIRWFQDSAGFGVKWFIYDRATQKEILVGAQPKRGVPRIVMPNQPVKVHLAIWAPGSTTLLGDRFDEALNPALKPAKNAKSAQKYFFDVAGVWVERGRGK